MKIIRIISLLILYLLPFFILAQTQENKPKEQTEVQTQKEVKKEIKEQPKEETKEEPKEKPKKKKKAIKNTFRSTRMINGHTIETARKGKLLFILSHRFYGPVSEGAGSFFGMDRFANIRFSFTYGLSDRLNLGLSRSRVGPIYDGFVKYKLFRQRRSGLPITGTLFMGMDVNTQSRNEVEKEALRFKHRLSYTSQLLLASQVMPALSLQIIPTLIHRNITPLTSQTNTSFAMGFGARVKINSRISLMMEYYRSMPQEETLNGKRYPSVAFGIDFITPTHVFQLHFTNVTALTESQFAMGTTEKFSAQGLRFGFNMIKTFTP